MAFPLLNLRRRNEPLMERAGMTLLDLSEAKAAQQRVRERNSEVKTVRESFGPNLFALTSSNDPQDWTYRRLTSPNNLRDLNPFMQLRQMQVAYYLKATNGWAKRIVEIIGSYVVGDGFNVICDSPKSQEVVDRFWNDPINRMDRAVREWCDELTTFGEICLPLAVNAVDGFVRLGYVDPMQIDYIEFGTMQTEDGAQEISFPVAIHLRNLFLTQQTKVIQIVRTDEEPGSPTFGRLTGDCFYFAINKAKSASRGISELFSLADWLDLFDQMSFDFGDKVRFLNQYVWDFALEGADQKTVEKFQEQITKQPPRQGGALVHNQQVKVTPLTPALQGGDMHEAMRGVKLFGLGAAGLPPTFFGDGLEANRSTADEMTGPTGKKLRDRQNALIDNIRIIVEFVLDQAVAHGTLSEKETLKFKIQTPELLIKDLEKAATTMNAVTGAVAVAEDRGWIQTKTAALAFHTLLGEIGVDVNSNEEFQAAQQEMETRNAKGIDGLKPQADLFSALNALRSSPAVLPQNAPEQGKGKATPAKLQ